MNTSCKNEILNERTKKYLFCLRRLQVNQVHYKLSLTETSVFILGHIPDPAQDPDPEDAEVADVHTVEADHMTAGQGVAAEVVQGVGQGHVGHPGHQGHSQGHLKKKHKKIMLTEC